MIKDGMRASERVSVEAGKLVRDNSKCWGILHGVLRGPDGKIKENGVQWSLNQFQTLGKQHVADRLSDAGETAMSHMAIGTGTGQAVGDNALASELGGGGRQALDGGTPSHSANVVTYHRAFAAGEGEGIVTEACIVNAGSGGTLMLYDDGINFTKGAADSLALTWTFTVN